MKPTPLSKKLFALREVPQPFASGDRRESARDEGGGKKSLGDKLGGVENLGLLLYEFLLEASRTFKNLLEASRSFFFWLFPSLLEIFFRLGKAFRRPLQAKFDGFCEADQP